MMQNSQATQTTVTSQIVQTFQKTWIAQTGKFYAGNTNSKKNSDSIDGVNCLYEADGMDDLDGLYDTNDTEDKFDANILDCEDYGNNDNSSTYANYSACKRFPKFHGWHKLRGQRTPHWWHR